MNFCAGDGTVAPTDYAVPADPAIFHWAGSPVVTPCSAVACSKCDCPVRWVDRASFDGDNDELAALYELSDPFAAPGVTGPGGDARLYFCRCDWFDCNTSMGLFLRWEVPQLGLPGSWTCGGHPTLDLPTEIGGETVPADVNWAQLLATTFQQPVDDADTHRWPRWVDLVYGRVTGTPHQSAIERAVAEFLVSDDDVLCSRAIRFLAGTPKTPSADLLLGLVDGLGDTLVGRPDPFDDDGADLYETALRGVATHVSNGRWKYVEPLPTLIRGQALRPGRLSGFVWFLAEQDRAWLKKNVVQLLEFSPGAEEEVRQFIRK
jgi:hypothetical protein